MCERFASGFRSGVGSDRRTVDADGRSDKFAAVLVKPDAAGISFDARTNQSDAASVSFVGATVKLDALAVSLDGVAVHPVSPVV